GRIDDDVVVEQGMGRERSGVVGEVKGRVAAAADGAARPRADRDLDDVARFEIGPADLGPARVGLLLFGERDAARRAVHARAQDLRLVALRGNGLVELFLRAGFDDDFLGVLDELRDAAI